MATSGNPVQLPADAEIAAFLRSRPPLQIGPFVINPPVLMAPMAGVTGGPFRRLARRFGAGAGLTEMVSAKGLIYKNHLTRRYLAHFPEEQPFWAQVFGAEPEVLAQAARLLVAEGVEIIDLNCGCPVKKVVRSGAGCALMREPEKAAALVRAMKAAVNVPLTVKFRAGWADNEVNAVEFGQAMAQAGAAALCLHPRTRGQGYGGRADWPLIARLKQAVTIPVIGNGDVAEARGAWRMFSETGCDAIMIGRAALGNPFLFAALTGRGDGAPSPAERLAVVLEHFAAVLGASADPQRAVPAFRAHLAWYSRGLAGAAQFRVKVMKLVEPDEIRKLCAEFFGGARRDSSAGAT